MISAGERPKTYALDRAAIGTGNVEDYKSLFCSSKFPWARERISLKFIGKFGTRPQNVLQACSRPLASKHFMAKFHTPYCGLVRGPHVEK
jgi:hypothetical protein